MALANLSFFGKSIGLTSQLSILLPDSGNGPFPVFYLLHGLSDDHTTWLRRTSLERYAADIPMIIVMPATGRGWYTNSESPGGRAYEDHITKDVLPFIDRLFPTIQRREGRVIGGLSMGGYGAVKLALKFPDTFCSATSHSGPLMTPLHKPESRPKELQAKGAEFEAIFGKDWRGGPNDPIALAKKCPLHLRPALRFDCGTNDFLLDQNREFHSLLNELPFPHEYQEFDGDHNWAYWDNHIQEALAFHRRQLHI
jgi:putative tributyrin esterase